MAGFTGLYGWKVEFEKSKPVVWVGLIVCVTPPVMTNQPFTYAKYLLQKKSPRYFLLTALQTLYAYFIEGDIVFVGKRKTFSKRVRSSLILRFLHSSHYSIP